MEWLAAMCTHIPNRGEQIVRYYGYYSSVSRGKRQRAVNTFNYYRLKDCMNLENKKNNITGRKK
jgi:hypothetical protein